MLAFPFVQVRLLPLHLPEWDWCHLYLSSIFTFIFVFVICIFWKAYSLWFLLLLDWPHLHGNSLPVFPIVIRSGHSMSQWLGRYRRWETQDLTRDLQLVGWPEGGPSLSPTSFYSCRDNNRDSSFTFERAQDSQLEGGPAFCSGSVSPLSFSGVSITLILKDFNCKEVGFPFGFKIRMIFVSVYNKNSQSVIHVISCSKRRNVVCCNSHTIN